MSHVQVGTVQDCFSISCLFSPLADAVAAANMSTHARAVIVNYSAILFVAVAACAQWEAGAHRVCVFSAPATSWNL